MYDPVTTIDLSTGYVECSVSSCNTPSHTFAFDSSYGTINQISSTDILLESQAYSDLSLIPSNPFPLELSVTTSGVGDAQTISMGSFTVEITDPCESTSIDSITGLINLTAIEGSNSPQSCIVDATNTFAQTNGDPTICGDYSFSYAPLNIADSLPETFINPKFYLDAATKTLTLTSDTYGDAATLSPNPFYL